MRQGVLGGLLGLGGCLVVAVLAASVVAVVAATLIELVSRTGWSATVATANLNS